MSLLIYGRQTSYNVQKVLWLLEELEVEYKHIQLGGRFGGLEMDEFKKLNPMQKVPVIVDDDKVIWESNTILRYLADTYGTVAFKVDDAFERSKYERWMDWSQSKFEPIFIGIFWGYYRTPEHLRDMVAIENSIQACQQCLEMLDDQLKHKLFILGDDLSLADISIGIYLYRLVEIELNIELPNYVADWYEHLNNSPGYRRWVMSDFSELKARLDY